MYLKQIMRPYKSIRMAELQWQQCQRQWPRSSWLTAPWDAHSPCGTRLSVPHLPWLLLKIGSLAFLLILSMVHLKPFQKNLFLLNLFLLFVAANHDQYCIEVGVVSKNRPSGTQRNLEFVSGIFGAKDNQDSTQH